MGKGHVAGARGKLREVRLALTDSIRERAGRCLEQGAPPGSSLHLASAFAATWLAERVSRPIELPADLAVAGVGGATLGGAGKTPLAIALARSLGEVAFVGHAYRARPGKARLVSPGDPLDEVGDDALAAARALASTGARVVVAPCRADAFAFVRALGFRLAIADGLLQTTPARLAASILTLDAARPWGSGACPPAGDLRAPREALLAAADLVAAVGSPVATGLPPGSLLIPSTLAGALSPMGELISLGSLSSLRLGLLLAIAHPERVLASLRSAGLTPVETILLGDHALPSPRLLARAAALGLDAWLTTGRCATKLPPSLGRAPVLALDHRLDVAALSRRVGALCYRAAP